MRGTIHAVLAMQPEVWRIVRNSKLLVANLICCSFDYNPYHSLVIPIILPFEFGEEAFDSGSTASVSCIVTKGDIPIDISWMFNGRRIDSNDGILITRGGGKISMLSIETVHSRHAGNYTCHASNKAGSVEQSSELQVMGKFRCIIVFFVLPSFFQSPAYHPSIRFWRRSL